MRCLAKFIIIATILSLAGPGFCLADEPAKLLISEVQIFGENGEDHNDYVKIYNPNIEPVDLGKYSLVKRATTNTDKDSYLIGSWETNTIIAPLGYHIWASNKEGYADNISANSNTVATITTDDGIAIRFGAKDVGTIIDSVGWGDYNGIFIESEGSTDIQLLPNPIKGQKLIRTDNQDTDNNFADFKIFPETPPADQTNDNDPAPIVAVSTGG
ncbi:MAG: lamin tail domain-containing protein, partial [bacterium]